MKSEKALGSSISILIGVVIFILAFVRGIWQTGLLIIVFLVWGFWITISVFIPYIHRVKRHRAYLLRQQELNNLQRELKKRERSRQRAASDAGTKELLLRHVNHRISSYLHALYPKATWEWCEKTPSDLICEGGVGRIRLYGVPEYDHGDIHIDRFANIKCDLVKIVPLLQKNENEEVHEKEEPVDPQIWFELQGRKILEEVIADLDSKGHNCLLIREDGNICVTQDKEETVIGNLPGFPAKVYWERLARVFESNGLNMESTIKGAQISW